MLSEATEEGYDAIVSWVPGDASGCFRVHDKDKFVETVMPKFFNQTKYKSFLRQLNLWGFERVLQSGPQRGGYKHAVFDSSNPEHCDLMRRTKLKGSKKKESNTDLVSETLHGQLDISTGSSLETIEEIQNPPFKHQIVEGIGEIDAKDWKYVLIGVKLGKLSGSKSLFDL